MNKNKTRYKTLKYEAIYLSYTSDIGCLVPNASAANSSVEETFDSSLQKSPLFSIY